MWWKWPDLWLTHWLQVWEMECHTITWREQVRTPVKIGRWGKWDKGRFQTYCRKRGETWQQPWADSFHFCSVFPQHDSSSYFMWCLLGCPTLQTHPALTSGVLAMITKAFCHYLVSSTPQPPQRWGMPKFFCKYVVEFESHSCLRGYSMHFQTYD